jgi:hypothetical protein
MFSFPFLWFDDTAAVLKNETKNAFPQKEAHQKNEKNKTCLSHSQSLDMFCRASSLTVLDKDASGLVAPATHLRYSSSTNTRRR